MYIDKQAGEKGDEEADEETYGAAEIASEVRTRFYPLSPNNIFRTSAHPAVHTCRHDLWLLRKIGSDGNPTAID